MTRRPANLSIIGPVLLVLALILLVISVLVLPEGYDPVKHSVSESAAQGVQHGWVARSAFVLVAMGSTIIAIGNRGYWTIFEQTCAALFGTGFAFVAMFSHRPWLEGAPVNIREDTLHSWAASIVGFAMVMLLASVNWRRWRYRRWWDWLVFVVILVVPPMMNAVASVQGLMQRTMFVLAFVWLIGEWWMAHRPVPAVGGQEII